MMVHSWSTQHVRVKVVDQASGEVTYIRPSVIIPVFKSYYNFDHLKQITKVKAHNHDSNCYRDRDRDRYCDHDCDHEYDRDNNNDRNWGDRDRGCDRDGDRDRGR